MPIPKFQQTKDIKFLWEKFLHRYVKLTFFPQFSLVFCEIVTMFNSTELLTLRCPLNLAKTVLE